MVTVGADLFKREIVALFDLLRDLQNCFCKVWRQECFSVFDRKDDVVVRIVYAVVASGDAHALSVFENRGFSNFPPRSPAASGRGKGFANIPIV